jgi:hypothetical protein
MYCALVFFATQDIVSAGFNDTPKPVGCQMCIGAKAKRRKIGFSYFFSNCYTIPPPGGLGRASAAKARRFG